MPEPNIAAFIELSSRGVCSRGTSTHGKQHDAAWAADHDCCVATWVSHLAVFWVAQHGLVNPTDLTSPFAAERVIDHAPLGQWAQVLHATYLHSM